MRPPTKNTKSEAWIGRRWPAWLGLLLAFCSRGAVQAQKATYNPVARDVVISRLRQSPRDNRQRAMLLQQWFEQAGCSGERLQLQPVKHLKIPNVICTLPGQSDSRILVSAHTDHVHMGDGTVDNWSGAAMLADLLESLGASPRRHTFVFIGFSGEEQGLVGSRFYADSIDPRTDIAALINMDSMGLAPTAVWLSHADTHLAEIARRTSAGMKLPLQAINVDKLGESDAEAFTGLHIPSITFHSVTQEAWPVLHSKKDTFAVIRVDDYYDSYRYLAGYLAVLDVELGSAKQPGDSSEVEHHSGTSQ